MTTSNARELFKLFQAELNARMVPKLQESESGDRVAHLHYATGALDAIHDALVAFRYVMGLELYEGLEPEENHDGHGEEETSS